MLADLSTRRSRIVHTVGLLLHFLTGLAHHKCVFFKGSERLQAVISPLTSGKFYRLPPDKEDPVGRLEITLRTIVIKKRARNIPQ